jgi:signal transduction histidine kinase
VIGQDVGMASPTVSPRSVDLALVGLTLVTVPALTAALGGTVTAGGTLPLTVTLAVSLLWRRRWPVAVLALSAATVTAVRVGQLTDVGWIWPATAAYASAALAGRLGWAVGIGAVQLWFAYAWEGFVQTGPSLGAVGVEALWLAAVLAGATAYRNWRRWQEEVVVRLRQSVHELELEAARRQAEERLRIAREVHDVVAHTLAVVGVHLNVAADALDTSPEQTRGAIAVAQRVRRDAMTDLAALVGVLRELPVTADLPAIVAAVGSADLVARLNQTGDPERAPGPVALSLTRLVQESLTNVVRHARAAIVTVDVHYGPSSVVLTITDDGRGPAADPAPTVGHGLAGMRERVAALGGTFSAGPGERSGFVVRAEIPYLLSDDQ